MALGITVARSSSKHVRRLAGHGVEFVVATVLDVVADPLETPPDDNEWILVAAREILGQLTHPGCLVVDDSCGGKVEGCRGCHILSIGCDIVSCVFLGHAGD